MKRPSGRFLLDTNVIIALLQGEPSALSNLERASEIFIPVIAVGELFFGAAKSGHPLRNTVTIDAFAAGRTIIPCDFAVAREFGRLKDKLRKKGRLLPENDIWIAASALSYSLVLVTRDHHFEQVDDLETVD